MAELATRDGQQLEAHPASTEVTPMQMLQMAVQQNADLDKLERLMDLQQRWEANEARKAFVAALNAFKADPPTLKKNKHVRYKNNKGSWTEYWHATLDHVADEIGKALSHHGLSFRWDVEQTDEKIRVTCVLTHDRGHSERVTMQAAADQSGGKNSIQAVGSTVTYLQRYTLLAATGMATEEQDDDGRGADEPEPPKAITDGQASQILDLLEATGTPEQRLLRFAFAGRPPQGTTIHDIPASMFERCLNKLNATLKQQREAGHGDR